MQTDEANELLYRQYGDYRFRSRQRDIAVHGVPLERIVCHHRPDLRLAEILGGTGRDAIESKVARVATILAGAVTQPRTFGVTGSVLMRAHHSTSDIDLVVYGLGAFQRVRRRVRQALGSGTLQPLGESMWRDAYERRGCSLTFEEYLWHERRKYNKFACDGTKVDISCVDTQPVGHEAPGRKADRQIVLATVVDDHDAYSYPARYVIEHASIGEIISYSPTYTGQACRGERVEASGWLEQMEDGSWRLIVGTSREAAGEYIKVVGSSGD